MPSPFTLDQIRHIDPARAIERRDLRALQACVDARWNPERRAPDPSLPSSYPLVDQVIFRGWGAGWKLLRTRWPHLLLEPSLILRAFQRLQFVIIEDMFDQSAITMNRPLVLTKDAWRLALEGLYLSAGRYSERPGGDEHALSPLEARATKTFEFLISKGLDPYAAYPGVFHPEDDRLEGHSAWTLALYQMRWGLANRLLPTSLEEVVRQPKLTLGLSQLIEEAFSPHQEARKMAQTLYARWLDRFGGWWFQQPGVHLLSDKREWSFVRALSFQGRQAVWEAWCRPQEQKVTELHMLALDAGQRPVALVLEQLLVDQGEPAAWTTPSEEGVRPCDLWALSLGLPLPPSPWSMSEAIEQTRRHGQGPISSPPTPLLSLV